MDNQKLYEALKTIQEACNEHRSKYDSCRYCPIATTYGECNITPEDGDAPLDWYLVEPEKAVMLLR